MFTANLKGLEDFIKRFDDPALKSELNKIPSLKGVAAIVAQAIADNFEKEGPGWKPLKAVTLRNSVKESILKKFEKRAMKSLRIKLKKGQKLDRGMQTLVNKRVDDC